MNNSEKVKNCETKPGGGGGRGGRGRRGGRPQNKFYKEETFVVTDIADSRLNRLLGHFSENK